MTPIFNGLILDLSKQVFDQRSAIGESDNQHTYTEALLTLALNRGCRDFLTALIEKETIEDVVKAVPEYVAEVSVNLVSGVGNMPPDALKGISLISNIVGDSIMIYVTPDKWEAIKSGYNIEDVGTISSRRWTEFSRQIYSQPTFNSPCNYMYIKNHIDIVVNGTNDILLNQRFFNQLLDLATAYIQKLSPVV